MPHNSRRFVSVRPYVKTNGTFVNGHIRGWPDTTLKPSFSIGCGPISLIMQIFALFFVLTFVFARIAIPLMIILTHFTIMLLVWIIQLFCVVALCLYQLLTRKPITVFDELKVNGNSVVYDNRQDNGLPKPIASPSNMQDRIYNTVYKTFDTIALLVIIVGFGLLASFIIFLIRAGAQAN